MGHWKKRVGDENGTLVERSRRRGWNIGGKK
jgi:hypothetical protein